MKSSVVSLQQGGHSFRNRVLRFLGPELVYNKVNSPSAFDLSDAWIPARPGFADDRRLKTED